jgi:hypothetical protein
MYLLKILTLQPNNEEASVEELIAAGINLVSE